MGIIDFSKEKCRNCYKCIRICPVKAIKLKDEHAQIISDMCIGCGYCIKICPQNAKEIQNDVSLVKDWLKNSQVVVSLSGVFPASSDMQHPRQYLGALRKLGFTIIEDVSVGMEAVALENEKEFKSDRHFVINSSCPAVKNLIEMYYPDYVKYLSRVVSPTIAHGEMLKDRYPDSKIVVIGACLAEKTEIVDSQVADVIDAVITFDELRQWFREEGVDPKTAPIEDFDACGSNQLNNWPMAVGLTEKDARKLNSDRNIISIESIENSMAFLNEIGKLKKKYWIQMRACEEGCMNGPGNIMSRLSKYEKVEMINTYLDLNQDRKKALPLPALDYRREFSANPVKRLEKIPPKELEDILIQMGKFSPKDELNCGTCGYDTCRDKARAVYLNMAEIEMCLPLISSKNEAISNLIITTTPNAIAVLDKKFRVIEFNEAAERLFNIKREEIFHYRFTDILDYNPFKKLQFAKDNNYTGKGIYERENRVFMEILTFIPEQQLYMGIFIDVTKQERQEKAFIKMQEETLSMAQRVIDKQMRVAHEIAGLLGETTAETKVTLTKLQKVVRNREEDI